MYVRIAVLADFANQTTEGKLNILGIFDRIIAPGVPVVHHQLKLVVRMEFDSTEVENKDIRVVLVDMDGRELFSMSGQLSLSRESSGQPTTVNNVLGLNNLVFPAFGDYEFKMLINGEVKATIPLSIVEQPSPDPE